MSGPLHGAFPHFIHSYRLEEFQLCLLPISISRNRFFFSGNNVEEVSFYKFSPAAP
jgi:hypothetical protein